MIDKEATSRLIANMIMGGASDTELSVVIGYSRQLLDIEKIYKTKISDLVDKYNNVANEED